MGEETTTQPEQTIVLLGNPNPQMRVKVKSEQPDGTVHTRTVWIPATHLKQSVTRCEMWQGFDDQEFVNHTLSTDNDRVLTLIGRTLDESHKRYAVGISEVEQIVAGHAAGMKPDWVASNDPEFAKALSEFYGCPIGEPQMLLTNAGRDALHAQNLSTSAPPATFNYMALANSSTATAPAATDTTLNGEITTAGGGLLRAQGTYAHTAGTNATTITKTFTANGSDTLPVTVSQDALFNAASGGTLGYKDGLNSNATLNISGDNITVTHTVDIG